MSAELDFASCSLSFTSVLQQQLYPIFVMQVNSPRTFCIDACFFAQQLHFHDVVHGVLLGSLLKSSVIKSAIENINV